jgi:hypothetical protein
VVTSWCGRLRVAWDALEDEDLLEILDLLPELEEEQVEALWGAELATVSKSEHGAAGEEEAAGDRSLQQPPAAACSVMWRRWLRWYFAVSG